MEDLSQGTCKRTEDDQSSPTDPGRRRNSSSRKSGNRPGSKGGRSNITLYWRDNLIDGLLLRLRLGLLRTQ